MAFFSWLKNPPSLATLEDLFGLDLRSLALVRMCVGAIILVDLAIRANWLTAHYGDLGVLPSSHAFSFWGDPTGVWSLHLLGGGPLWLLAVLFIVHACAAIALLIGYRTRIATVVTWALVVSLHNADLLIVQGGDILLRAVLFVGMFLPWGTLWSVDSKKYGTPGNVRIVSTWSAAYIFQLAFLYFFAVSHKEGPEWLQDGTAVYYALSIDQRATTLGKFLLTSLPDTLPLITIGVVALQVVAPFLFFFPLWNSYIRSATVWCLMTMHLAFALCLYLGPFSWVSIAALCGLIPSGVWDEVAVRLRQWRGAFARPLSTLFAPPPLISGSEPRARPWSYIVFSIIGSVLGIAYVVYIFLWQAAGSPSYSRYVSFPPSWEIAANVLRIDQGWDIFTSAALHTDGWYVIPGVLQNGERVDVHREGAPVSFEKPDDVAVLYGNERWRKYLMGLRSSNLAEYRQYYAKYLCRTWNDSHEAEEYLVELEIIFMQEETLPPPGSGSVSVEPDVLLRWNCDNGQDTRTGEER